MVWSRWPQYQFNLDLFHYISAHKLTMLYSIILIVLLGSSGTSFALPPCPVDRHPTNSPWSECFGTYTYSSGNVYVGEFKGDKAHGQGTYTWPNGKKYIGQYTDDKRSGQGVFTFGNGDKYVGEYKDGKRDGQGTYTYGAKSKLPGDKYVGEFRDGKYHGKGIYIFANGTLRKGIWKNNEFQFAKQKSPRVIFDPYIKSTESSSHSSQSCPGSYNIINWTNCFGFHTDRSGNKYIGEFKNGKPNGQGTYTFANGTRYVGEWKDGKRNGKGYIKFADGGV